MKITLFIPVLNEIDGLKLFLPQIPKNLFEQILIVDGQSTDGSADWAKSNGYEIYVQKKLGLRNAYKEAWPYFRGDAVISFSPDGNCKIEDLPKLIQKFKEGYDMVIASRYLENAKSEDDSITTSLGNWFFTKTINLLHRGKYTDAMTIYRIYKKNLFYSLHLEDDASYAPEKWFRTKIGVEPLLSVRALQANLKIGEIPSDEPKRIVGKSKLQTIRWGLAYMSQVIRERFSTSNFEEANSI